MTVAPADSTSRASTPPSTRSHHPHPRSYGMDPSHSRPFFDSKWNRQGVGRIRCGIETHRFSQLSNQELAPIEMCLCHRGRGGGEALLSPANPVPIAPCFCSKSAGPHPNPPPQKGGGDGRRRPFPSSRAPFFNGDGPGWGEPLPSRARNPLSIAPCFCRKSAGQPGRHRSLNYCTTGPPNPRTTHNPRPPCGQGKKAKQPVTLPRCVHPIGVGLAGVIHARRNAIVAVRWREQEFTEHRHFDQKRSLSF